MQRSLSGDSTKDSKEVPSPGEPGRIPTLKAWEGSRLRIVGLDVSCDGCVSGSRERYGTLLSATP